MARQDKTGAVSGGTVSTTHRLRRLMAEVYAVTNGLDRVQVAETPTTIRGIMPSGADPLAVDLLAMVESLAYAGVTVALVESVDFFEALAAQDTVCVRCGHDRYHVLAVRNEPIPGFEDLMANMVCCPGVIRG